MIQAVIVSTARTPICKGWRAGIEPQEVEDVIMGCATPEGATGYDIERQMAIRAGLPFSVLGVKVNRFCSSGL